MLSRDFLYLYVLIILSFAVDMGKSRSSRAKNPGLSADERNEILNYHNYHRSKVQPTASNMLYMSWHSGAAWQAQRYANQCQFLKHNDAAENTVPQLGACGQNLYVSSAKTTWSAAMKSWFVENKKFTYGDSNLELKAIGHYTQMVWATSHKVGCGMAYCSGGPWGQFYNYVCHYCPTGNFQSRLHTPYKRGNPCQDCPNHCNSDGLCSNACNQRDYYSNCADLVSKVHGYCQQGTCNATCECGNEKIH